MKTEILSFFNQKKNVNQFDQVKISIASADKIRSWSYGEVKKSETINYRTFKPEKDGLMCCKIFGPVKDYECLCGKYKRMKYKGVICEKCGVEVTSSKVRRERMGHIELAAPVVHIWFLRSLPSKISMLLDMTLKDIEKILYFELYIIIDPGMTSFGHGELISEEDYLDAQDEHGEDNFTAMTGAEAIQSMLASLDLEEIKSQLRNELVNTNSDSKRKKLSKRLNIVNTFLKSSNKPQDMVLDVLPIICPDLRPLVMLDGGRFATSDLNELYRRVINRNNRLRRLIELKAPDLIVRNEKRMLQESVDALFDNGRRGRVVKGVNKRAFKSLSDMLKGKQGRFRQNLLGKRVDYSGRSVIVVGPDLKLHQCGLPKKMAMELFKPFVYSRLVLYGQSSTIKMAKKMLDRSVPEVWDALEEVIREHPILLNRAPTLHRLGIQAFEPQLIEGHAIQLHPLVCGAFNADFDGDQMAVHVPLSIESQIEARVLMMSTNNILAPSNGKPIIVPSQDIVLGLYYLTLELEDKRSGGTYFVDFTEIEYALDNKNINYHSIINVASDVVSCYRGEEKVISTTAGRIMVANLLPKQDGIDFALVDKLLVKKEITSLMDMVYRHCGQKATVIFADHLMKLGFEHACLAGVSIGKDDILIPPTKDKHVQDTIEKIELYANQYSDGLITSGEKYNKVVDAWSKCTDDISNDMMDLISHSGDKTDNTEYNINVINSVYMMADSGARGSAAQIKQLAGMRGLMAKPSGDIIETPIISNFKEGLSSQEYFISTHGARKGLADTALKTANSGYLTRRLVDVAQDCIVTEFDCGTTEGISVGVTIEGGEVVVALSERVLGRVLAHDLVDRTTQEVLISANTLLDEDKVSVIEVHGFDNVVVRSVLKCKAHHGVCAVCYGRDLAMGEMVSVGEAVGVVAAQSIGEPGTQLTMRTFHIGGAATSTTKQSVIESNVKGLVELSNDNVIAVEGHYIVMSRNLDVTITSLDNKSFKTQHRVQYGSKLYVSDKENVNAGQKIADWDPHTVPILTEYSGVVRYDDLISGVSLIEDTDQDTGISRKIVSDWRQNSNLDIKPRVSILDQEGNVVKLPNNLDAGYYIPVGAIMTVDDQQAVKAGDVIAKIPRASTKTRDITGGLPRVVELFEVRKPKNVAIMSEIDGVITFGKDYKTKRRIVIEPSDSELESAEYMIPKGRHVIVNEGDFVKRGDMIVEGDPSLQDILNINGVDALTEYMVNEIQSVYRLQGVKIDDKHIEVVIGQMLNKVEITDAGDTVLMVGEQIHKTVFDEINNEAEQEGYRKAEGYPVVQGITKSSLQTRSFISAASFQETTRILSDAAIAGRVDHLLGLKENVIVGRTIPAGTGHYINKVRHEAVMDDSKMIKELGEDEEEFV